MEVQTFILCKEMRKGEGNSYDAHLIGLHNLYPTDGKFPFDFTMPYYMLLRRASRGPEEPVTLRFRLVDEDGDSTGNPQNFITKGSFPEGHRFWVVAGTIKFSFPGYGDYRLDIRADEHKMGSLFQYDIEIKKP